MLLSQPMIELLYTHIKSGGSIQTFLQKYKIDDTNVIQIKGQLTEYMKKINIQPSAPIEEPKMPSIVSQAKGLAGFIKDQAIDIATKGTLKTPVNLGDKRIAICRTCPHFNKESKRCSLCGCYMENKTKFSAAKCPDTPPRWL